MTNEDESLALQLTLALTEADRELLQAKNRITLLEQTLRNTERELLRVKSERSELEHALHNACLIIDDVTCDTDGMSETLVGQPVPEC